MDDKDENLPEDQTNQGGSPLHRLELSELLSELRNMERPLGVAHRKEGEAIRAWRESPRGVAHREEGEAIRAPCEMHPRKSERPEQSGPTVSETSGSKQSGKKDSGSWCILA